MKTEHIVIGVVAIAAIVLIYKLVTKVPAQSVTAGTPAAQLITPQTQANVEAAYSGGIAGDFADALGVDENTDGEDIINSL